MLGLPVETRLDTRIIRGRRRRRNSIAKRIRTRQSPGFSHRKAQKNHAMLDTIPLRGNRHCPTLRHQAHVAPGIVPSHFAHKGASDEYDHVGHALRCARGEREELNHIEAPPPTQTWYPVRHSTVVESVSDLLQAGGFQIQKATYAVSRQNARMFTTLDLATPLCTGVTLAVGLRNSTDQSFPLASAPARACLSATTLRSAPTCWLLASTRVLGRIASAKPSPRRSARSVNSSKLKPTASVGKVQDPFFARVEPAL